MEDHDLLITLNSKMDSVLKIVEDTEKRVRGLENKSTSNDEKVETLEKEVEKLRSKTDLWSTINSIGVFLGAVLGIVK